MDEQPNLDALARRFLDLWQDQITAVAGTVPAEHAGAGGSGSAESCRQALDASFVALLQASSAPLLGAWLAALSSAGRVSGEAEPSRPGADGADRPAAPGTAPVAGPSGRGPGHLEQLERRVAALEERLAALERGAAPGRRSPGKGVGRPRS